MQFEKSSWILPICFCLDTSSSMSCMTSEGSSRIQAVRDGLEEFCRILKGNEYAEASVEISIVTFGGDAKCIMPFTEIHQTEQFPEFYPDGLTAMGEGLLLGIDLLQERKNLFRSCGVKTFMPMLMILTDGIATDPPQIWNSALTKAVRLCDEGKMVFIAGAIDMDSTSASELFSPKRVFALKDSEIKVFFQNFAGSILEYIM